MVFLLLVPQRIAGLPGSRLIGGAASLTAALPAAFSLNAAFHRLYTAQMSVKKAASDGAE
jgi:hypothetical protein